MAMDGAGTVEETMLLSESQRAVLQKYLIHDERGWEDVARRVARFVAQPEKTEALQKEWEAKFYAILASMKLVPGGSILANSDHGTRGLLNCFVLSAEDHIQDIAKLVTDAVLTTKFRGGVGINIGSEGQKGYIRPKGSAFADGRALGPCAVLDMVSETSKKITTGNKARRGAFLFSMHWKHPDIHEFVQAKTQSVMDAKTAKDLVETAALLAVDTTLSPEAKNERLAQLKSEMATAWTETHLSPDGKRDRRWHNANISVQLDDEFFTLLESGDTTALELWQKIAQFAHDTADPGLLLIDNAKRRSPIREFITCTNPCVTADTWVHTGDGPRQVRDLIDQQHSTYVNGELFSTTTQGFFATGVKPVLSLKTKEGFRLRLTGNHQVLKVTAQTRRRQYTEWVPAEALQPGDQVMLHDHRGLQPWDGAGNSEEGWLLGMLVGDGSLVEVQGKSKAVLRFWEETREGMAAHAVTLLREASGTKQERLQHQVVTSTNLARLAESFAITSSNKYNLSGVERGSFDFYRGFLRGFFDAEAFVLGDQSNGIQIRLPQSNRAVLEAVQRMLLRMGIASTLGKSPIVRRFQALYELSIGSDNIHHFAELVGFQHPDKLAKLRELLAMYPRTASHERFMATVESLTPDGVEAVYDCTVPGPSRFDANGLVVHNCGEIYLPPNSACNLASLNMSKFAQRDGNTATIDWDDLGKTVEIAVRFLDNVLDMAEFATEAQKHNVRNVYRQLGLGIMGWADWLKLCRVPYDSQEHLGQIDAVGRFIAERAYRASEHIAAEKAPCGIWPEIAGVRTGNPFEQWVDENGKTYRGDEVINLEIPVRQTPRRNSTVLSIAPTGSIAQLAACSWAFEPDFGLTIWKQVYVDASRSQQNWVQILNPYLEDLGLSEADTQLVMQSGSLQATTFAQANPETAAAFRISREIPWKWHVLAQAQWQMWVDSSISKTINCSRETTVEEIKEMYRFAHSNGLKGITVYREGTLESEPVKIGSMETKQEASETGLSALPEMAERAKPQAFQFGEARPTMLDQEVTEAAGLLGIQYDDGPVYLAEDVPLDGWTSQDFKGGCGGGVLHYQVWQRGGGRKLLVVRSDSYSMCYVKG
jgi:ribonucleoside-diphosphate reductase alpha chain